MRREAPHTSIVSQDIHVAHVMERREEIQIVDLVIGFRHIVNGFCAMLGSF